LNAELQPAPRKRRRDPRYKPSWKPHVLREMAIALGRTLCEYALLMRLHRPIGIWLLLWPALWALWIAGQGRPDAKLLLIFVTGVVVMRSAGCIINDYADRDFDPSVARTADRPLAAKRACALRRCSCSSRSASSQSGSRCSSTRWRGSMRWAAAC
jgi:hypothetical protein